MAAVQEGRNAYRILVDKPEGNNYLESLLNRFYSINKMDLKEIAFDTVNWINLAQGRGQWFAPLNIVIS